MRKIIVLLICAFILNLYGSAQIASFYANEWRDSAKVTFGITEDAFVNASTLTASFINRFYNGGYIDSDFKNREAAKIKNSNNLGAEMNLEIYTTIKLDSFLPKRNFHLYFGVKDRQHFDMSFPKDFFYLVFYGNSMYKGKTADLSKFSMNFIRYQQLQMGLLSAPNSNAKWGIAFSFLKGEEFRKIDARKAYLYTDKDALAIDFDTEMQMQQSNPDNKGFNAFNGYGASMDLYLETPFKTPLGNSKFCISVTDIGLLHFNDNSIQRKQDSVFHYSGININSILDLPENIILDNIQDTLQEKIFPVRKKSTTITLPSTFHFYQETVLNRNFHLAEGIRYIFNANNKVLFYLKGIFYFNSNSYTSVMAGYGGYGKLNTGIAFGSRLGKTVSIYAGSNNMEGFIVPSKTEGRSVYFSIIKNFY